MRSIQIDISMRRPEPETDDYETARYIAVSRGPNGSTVYTGPAGLLCSRLGLKALPDYVVDRDYIYSDEVS